MAAAQAPDFDTAMVEYKDTLNLPKTGFPMRAGLAQKEPKMLAAWEAQDLYGRIQQARRKAPKYVLHDGPPYANGRIHYGHILNKVLKDIVVKDRTMAGHRVPYVPGWDCHGLPIEVQVDKRLGKKKADMDKAAVRRACREYAEEFVGIQRDQFKRLGVFGRWEDPYLTMSYAYEAQTLRELATFVQNGLLYKGLRPVNWCSTHQTALAEAEVEYEDHTSPSVYVAFALEEPGGLGLGNDADIVIWTTTPWTLPANLATTVHPTFEYVAYPVKGRTRIFAKGLGEAFLSAVGEAWDEAKVEKTFTGKELEGQVYRHPLFDRVSPVLVGEHVTLEAGTGCVHTAPGHGADDFDIGRQNNLDVLSPVDNRGVFTDEAGPFAGQHVFKANPLIVEALVAAGALLNAPDETITHRYAHCWRCHKPIITRATEQWWVAIDRPFAGGGSLRERALAALVDVQWIPEWGEARIRGMLEARPDWCLSRQRTWGVPIAVVYCTACNTPHVDHEGMRRVADVFDEEGADAWFTRSVADLFGELRCAECQGSEFRKEEDILDVWFDSGVSFAAVILRENEGHPEGAPVDMYLEGSDQHRGWFHSALLVALATRQTAPYRKVLTHGFVVDQKGITLSKSKGNFVDPFKKIDQEGAELFRLWVASADYREEIRYTNEVVARLSDTYRKMRNTLRYILGNVSDFDPNTDAVSPDDLLELDRYALGMVEATVAKVLAAYRTHNFHVVVHAMSELCTVDLSAFYFDVLKDRVYASAAGSVERRSAQTALYSMGRDILRALAPVLCFTTEEAWAELPRLAGDPSSVHLCAHPGTDEPEAVRALKGAAQAAQGDLGDKYDFLREVRGRVNAVLEPARRAKELGSSVEAAVTLVGPEGQIARLREVGPAGLADLFIVSQVTLVESAADAEISVTFERAGGTKCARCWLYRDDVGHSDEHPTICGRCTSAVGA